MQEAPIPNELLTPPFRAYLEAWSQGRTDPELAIDMTPQQPVWTLTQIKHCATNIANLVNIITQEYLLPSPIEELSFSLRIPGEEPYRVVFEQQPTAQEKTELAVVQEVIAQYGGKITTEVSPDQYRHAIQYPLQITKHTRHGNSGRSSGRNPL